MASRSCTGHCSSNCHSSTICIGSCPALSRHGGVVLGVDVAHRARVRGTSKYKILDRLLVGISDVVGVIWLLRRAPRQGEVVEMARQTKHQKKGKAGA